MGIYVGLGEGSKEISGIYVGNGVEVKEVYEGYVSDADSNVKEIYSSVEPGQRIFTTSGTFTVPDKVRKVDVFLVGGGGMGGAAHQYSNDILEKYGGGGGGGGYTKTVKGISVIPGQQYSIVVGDRSEKWEWNTVYTGGESTALGYSAAGGKNCCFSYDARGGNGGSGGGNGTYFYCNSNTIFDDHKYPGNGGSDGSNGYKYSSVSVTEGGFGGGTGQGTTTRAFGEETGTLYAGGGGAGNTGGYLSSGGAGGGGNGAVSGNYGTSGTGGGGGGSSSQFGYSSIKLDAYYYRVGPLGGFGGSGIVIIRWGY